MSLIAAVYARKSTDQTGVSDEQRSVARQVQHACEYAARKGWTVDERYVFVDDGVSGAEFANRPGFVRLMNALKPQPPFQFLIMSEDSRLGREAIETAYALKQLVTAGVRVFFYLEDRERTLDSPIDKAMLALQTMADEMERERARQRTYDALRRRAERGYVVGGRTFGYSNVRGHGVVEREIDPDEAAVVRRIFALTAGGHGFTSVAKLLNAERVVSPRPQPGRPAGWVASSVRDILNRPLYRGEALWNSTRKRNRWGQRAQTARPEGEWLRIAVPALAIVSDHLWTAAHHMMSQQRARYHKTPGVRGGPPSGFTARYLLSGLCRCGVCGSGVEIRSRRHGQTRAYFLGCAGYARRGTTVCANRLTVPMDVANHGVLASLQRSLLHPKVLGAAIDRAAERLRRPAASREPVQRELDILDAEMRRLTAAIAAGGELDALILAVRERQTRRQGLLAELALYTESTSLPSSREIMTDLRGRLHEWWDVFDGQPDGANRLLRQLIVGRLTLYPDAVEDAAFYRFAGTGTVLPVLAGLLTTEQRFPLGTPRSSVSLAHVK